MSEGPNPRENRFPPQAVFILGAGHFGRRAALLLLREHRASELYAVDTEEEALSFLRDRGMQGIRADAVGFAVENVRFMRPGHLLIPAVPLHLAFEWLKGHLGPRYTFRVLGIPRGALGRVPQVWNGQNGDVLVSYADFLCPDDCPEPDCCTVTGERREHPMYAVLAALDLGEDFGICIVRSRQIAPGLGGYRARDLMEMAAAVASGEKPRWVLGTACRCHGVLSAFEIRHDAHAPA